VVDINPRKQGHYVAGTGQTIVGPKRLHAFRPDVVLVMNPLYRREILQALQGLGVRSDVVSIAPHAA
jgi:C-methyltransferase C-terminal domain